MEASRDERNQNLEVGNSMALRIPAPMQARTIDVSARRGKFIGKAPDFVTNDVLAKLQTIIE